MSLVEHAPKLSLEDAMRLASELYGLSGSVELLPSERDQNFLFICDPGERFVLKIANATEEYGLLEAQNQVMEHAARQVKLLPNVIDSVNGKKIETVILTDEKKHFVRLLTYLPGMPMGNVKRHSPELMFDLGRNLGELEKALQGYDHPALHREFHWGFASGLDVVKKNIKLVRNKKLRNMTDSLAKNFEKFTNPYLPHLRTGTVYNDANDYNILVGGGDDIYSFNQSVTGFIDLGDMLHGYIVGDLAIAIAYAILNKPQPLAVAAEIVKGFHSVFKLTEKEIAALFGFVTLRLCMSVCIGAEQQRSQPDNEYLGISQQPIQNTLPKLMKLHPHFVEAVFRNACRLTPFASSTKVVKWLNKKSMSFSQVLPVDLRKEPLVVFDLSIGSPVLNGDPSENAEPKLTRRLDELMKNAGAEVGIGQYDEARYFYTSPIFATGDNPTDETRTIHLGVDLFARAGMSIHAPLDGRVAAFADNAQPLDYGPVIILEHEIDKETKFYTLYGHLSRKSLKGLRVGKQIKKGKKFAEIGTANVNGGWTPHLHFQIIVDLLGLGNDFPGVAQPSQSGCLVERIPRPQFDIEYSCEGISKACSNKSRDFSDKT